MLVSLADCLDMDPRLRLSLIRASSRLIPEAEWCQMMQNRFSSSRHDAVLQDAILLDPDWVYEQLFAEGPKIIQLLLVKLDRDAILRFTSGPLSLAGLACLVHIDAYDALFDWLARSRKWTILMESIVLKGRTQDWEKFIGVLESECDDSERSAIVESLLALAHGTVISATDEEWVMKWLVRDPKQPAMTVVSLKVSEFMSTLIPGVEPVAMKVFIVVDTERVGRY